jgi:hypothetical protein
MGRPQALINPLIERSDVFVGLLWSRFGTATGSADSEGRSYGSGTEEEFHRALERWRRDGGSPTSLPRIIVYFSDQPVPPQSVSTEQLARVQAFRAQFAADGPHPGLTARYGTIEEFSTLLHTHLIQVAFDLSDRNARADALTDFVRVPTEEWSALMRECRSASLLFMYSRTWRNTFLNDLRAIVVRGGDIRVLLPAPNPRSACLQVMCSRIQSTPETLANTVWEAVRDFRALAEGQSGSVEVRFAPMDFTHALYLFDTGGFLAVYSYRRDRAPSPVIRLRPGPLLDQCLDDFNNVFAAAEAVPPEEQHI